MLGAWLLLWGSVALGGRADTAFLRRAHDSSGHCTYSFTVASPVEAACPEAAAEPGGARDPQQVATASRLEAAYGELLRAKSRLEEEKGRLEREKEELGRRLESSAQEITRLRAARCPPGREGVSAGAGTPAHPCRRLLPSGRVLVRPPCSAPIAAPRSWGSWWAQPCWEVAAHCPIPPSPARLIPSPAPQQRGHVGYRANLETITAEREIPGAGYHGQYPYSWGGYTDIDLAVDETGLWVIYSTEKARGAIVLSKLDPETLEIRRTWETNIRKRGVANSFLICGTLYTVSSYSAPNATINFAYDTATGTSRALSIPFENRFRYLSMLDYNPAERQLFAWDSFNMVTYPVRLSRQ
uniref:Myocilin n=1 Tax=Serinus canaria TaxID=9135 RepID=A0A8C9U3E1_SERCA